MHRRPLPVFLATVAVALALPTAAGAEPEEPPPRGCWMTAPQAEAGESARRRYLLRERRYVSCGGARTVLRRHLVGAARTNGWRCRKPEGSDGVTYCRRGRRAFLAFRERRAEDDDPGARRRRRAEPV